MDNEDKKLNEVIKQIQVCPVCKAVTNGDKYCHNCGKYLLEEENGYKFCNKCGNKLDENARYCNKCGNRCDQQNFNENNNQERYEENEGKDSVIALIGLICSIVGLFVVPLLLGIASIVLGIIGKCQSDISEKSNKQATAAIVLGVIDAIWYYFAYGFIIGFLSTL